MTKQDIYQLFGLLQAVYPDAFRGLSDTAAQVKLNVWQDIFRDDPPEQVMAAARTFISRDKKGFMPVPGQLKEILAGDNAMGEQEAWALVTKALRRSTYYSHEEFDDILSVYSKYPVSKLIVHPRVREEYYRGEPNLESFKKAYEYFKECLCYNGDICSADDYHKIDKAFPDIYGIMIGRGCIKNPAIFREIKGGKRLSTSELIAFSKVLEERYLNLFESETNTLYKLKEVWMYAITNYPNEQKIIKAVKKASKLAEFNSALSSLPELT